MEFSSLVFLCIFLPVTIAFYYLLPGIKLKNAWLILVSLLFYAYGEPIYVLLMIASTIGNYGFGLLLGRENASGEWKKAVLALAVVLNIASLVVFKYANLLVEWINLVPGVRIPSPNIALPVGISFFTFQAMSYVIDVYRGKCQAQRNYFYVLLYISYFPQLIAGPIVQYKQIERQITERKASLDEISAGLRRFSVGLAKKVLISNVMGNVAHVLFLENASTLGAAAAWAAGITYTLQIYYDFSGYSDMAIGLGRMFGFSLPENFNYPYISGSIQEFWRRWHISLSSWFRDYLYIPLGGNRKGEKRTAANKMIVFIVTGIWHGANLTFFLWGFFHGIMSYLELKIRKNVDREPGVIGSAIGHLYTLIAVIVSFVMFNAANVTQGFTMIGQMFTGFGAGKAGTLVLLHQLTPKFLLILAFGIIGAGPWVKNMWTKANEHLPREASVLLCNLGALLLLTLCLLSLAGGSYNPFIYFQF